MVIDWDNLAIRIRGMLSRDPLVGKVMLYKDTDAAGEAPYKVLGRTGFGYMARPAGICGFFTSLLGEFNSMRYNIPAKDFRSPNVSRS